MDSITALAEKPAARNGKVAALTSFSSCAHRRHYAGPGNDQVYRPVDPNDPDILALPESIGKYGVKVPLVLTEDNYLLSGHRALVASRLAGLETVPCMIEPICRWLRDGDKDRTRTTSQSTRSSSVCWRNTTDSAKRASTKSCGRGHCGGPARGLSIAAGLPPPISSYRRGDDGDSRRQAPEADQRGQGPDVGRYPQDHRPVPRLLASVGSADSLRTC